MVFRIMTGIAIVCLMASSLSFAKSKANKNPNDSLDAPKVDAVENPDDSSEKNISTQKLDGKSGKPPKTPARNEIHPSCDHPIVNTAYIRCIKSYGADLSYQSIKSTYKLNTYETNEDTQASINYEGSIKSTTDTAGGSLIISLDDKANVPVSFVVWLRKTKDSSDFSYNFGEAGFKVSPFNIEEILVEKGLVVATTLPFVPVDLAIDYSIQDVSNKRSTVGSDETLNGKTTFTEFSPSLRLRFPTFEAGLSYSPTIHIEEENVDKSSNGTTDLIFEYAPLNFLSVLGGVSYQRDKEIDADGRKNTYEQTIGFSFNQQKYGHFAVLYTRSPNSYKKSGYSFDELHLDASFRVTKSLMVEGNYGYGTPKGALKGKGSGFNVGLAANF